MARENAGFKITSAVRVGDVEMVLGYNPENKYTPYVTWECFNGDRYYWGHYIQTELEAVSDLVKRVAKELNALGFEVSYAEND